MTTTTNKVMRMMKQASNVKNPKHFQLLYGRFQKAVSHLSADVQESAKREFRRIARASYDRAL